MGKYFMLTKEIDDEMRTAELKSSKKSVKYLSTVKAKKIPHNLVDEKLAKIKEKLEKDIDQIFFSEKAL